MVWPVVWIERGVGTSNGVYSFGLVVGIIVKGKSMVWIDTKTSKVVGHGLPRPMGNHIWPFDSEPALPLQEHGLTWHIGWDIPTRWVRASGGQQWMDDGHGHPLTAMNSSRGGRDNCLTYVDDDPLDGESEEARHCREAEDERSRRDRAGPGIGSS